MLKCSWIRSRAKATFKIWNFYFAQILTVIVEKQHRHVLAPFNFCFKFSHSLTLFPIFSLHVNWVVFYTSLDFIINSYYAIISRRNKESSTWSSNSVWIWKLIVDETREVQKSKRLQMFYNVKVLKNFPIFTRKHLSWSFRPATLFKRDSNTGVVLWILQNV